MDHRSLEVLDVVLVDLRGAGEVVEDDCSDEPQLATSYLNREGGSSEGIRVIQGAHGPVAQ
jgi:hypothetical protein